MTDEPRQISVSRDALRADLAEMELRLRGYFDTALAAKADRQQMNELTKRVDLHESGIFPPAWELRVKGMIEVAIDESTSLASEGRYRLTGVLIAMLSSTAAIVGTILYAIVH